MTKHATDSSVVAVIPARAGSKGLPRKNLLPLAGLPLIAHAVLCARECACIDRVVVSTDDPVIAAVARQYGAEVPFLRPAELADDRTPMWPVLQHALTEIEATQERPVSSMVLLQPTNPGRLPVAIERAVARLEADAKADGIVAVAKPDFKLMWQSVTTTAEGRMELLFPEAARITRRQQLAEDFFITGSFYVFRRALLCDADGWMTGEILVEETPSAAVIDIDTRDQYEHASRLLAQGSPVLPWVPSSHNPASTVRYDKTHTAPLWAAGAAPQLARPVLPIAPVVLGDRVIGPGLPCFVIAEAGVNHNGDVALAHALIDKAADAGVDCVKFQTFVPEKLVSPKAQKAEYQVANTGDEGSQLDMLRGLTLSRDAHVALKQHAEERGLIFLSSPFDEESADFLEELDIPAFKIPSGEITNHPFVAHLARKGRPILMSSGMATIQEIAEALAVIYENGAPPVALFHCVSNYPAPPVSSNLKAMDTLSEVFRVPVGWSDHTEGIMIAVASAARGAPLLEKHFTLDKAMPGPDHKASLDPTELHAMMVAIREVEQAIGHGAKLPTHAERDTAKAARKSVCAVRELEAGRVLTAEDLAVLRPGTGLAPRLLHSLVGKVLRRGVAIGNPLQADDVEGL